MKEWFRKLLDSKIVMAVVSIVFGTVLIAERGAAVAFIVKLFGWVMVAAAVAVVAAERPHTKNGTMSPLSTMTVPSYIPTACPKLRR